MNWAIQLKHWLIASIRRGIVNLTAPGKNSSLKSPFLCQDFLKPGTVSRPSIVYFIKFCQIFAMKLNVCENITLVDLNDKTVPSLQ